MSIGANEGYPRGKLITDLPKGSWQAKELKKPGGMRFYEPIPYAERLERPPVDQQVAGHIGELAMQAVDEPERLPVAC